MWSASFFISQAICKPLQEHALPCWQLLVVLPLAQPLSCAQRYFHSKIKQKKLSFCFVFYSLIRTFVGMKETKWKDNVILVDADYVDKVAFDLTVNFERMLGRRLDGGLRPTANSQKPTATCQVVLLHKQSKMENFLPGSFAELDGKAFEGRLGEFLISCVKVEDLTTMDDLFIDSMQVLSNAEEVKRLIVVPDAEHIYNKVREGLRHADDEKRITVLAMQPMEGGNFRQEILGYSLMAALGIKSEELNKMS